MLLEELKRNSIILIIISMINLIVLWNFISRGNALHGIGYFIFFYVAIFIIHYYTDKIPPRNELVVKNPSFESKIAILFAVLGIIFISLNFMMKSNELPSTLIVKIPIILGVLFFTFPVGIIIYLLLKKYKLTQLGIIINPIKLIFLGLIIWGLTGIFSISFHQSGMLWTKAFKEFGGIVGILIQGVIGAALVEEFFRFVIQSRLEKLMNKVGLNILFASIIWSFMHFPVEYSKGNEISSIISYCLQIIPLGFVWGYLTHRTKSILPSVIAHGFNLWGFQNG